MSDECRTVGRLCFQDKDGPTIITIQPDQTLEIDYNLNVYIDGQKLEGVRAWGIERNGTG